MGGTPTKGWIYNSNIKGTGNPDYTWLLSPFAIVSSDAFFVDSSGNVGNNRFNGICGYVGSSLSVRPVVYLTSDVKITSGEGTSSDPYKLSK